MSSFLKNTIKLTTGNMVAQLIGIVSMPVLTHFFSPEAFGVLGMFLAVISITGAISTFCYDYAIMLPVQDEDAAVLFNAAMLIAFLFSAILLGVIWTLKILTPEWLDILALGKLIYLVPLMTFLMGCFKVLNRWYARQKHFGSLGKAMIIQRTVSHGLLIAAGAAGFTSGFFLISSRMAALFLICALLMVWLVINDKQLFLRSSFSLSGIKEGIKAHRNFYRYAVWSELLSAASLHIPVLLLGVFFSSQVVGFFTLGRQVLSLPMLFIGQAIAQVFFQRAMEAKYQGVLPELVDGMFKKLVIFGVFPFVILLISGENLFSLVFGSNWHEAGIYVQMLSLWMLFQWISTVLTIMYTVVDKMHLGMYLNIFQLFLRIMAVVIGGFAGNAYLAVLLLGLFGLGAQFAKSIVLLRISKTALAGNMAYLVKAMIFALVCALPVIAGEIAQVHIVVYCGLIALGTLFYYIPVLKRHQHLLYRGDIRGENVANE